MSEENFSARLSEAMHASGLSQVQIAKKAGITAPYLSDLRKGKKANPSQQVIESLARALSTTPAWLMSYTDPSGITVVPAKPTSFVSPKNQPRAGNWSQATERIDLTDSRAEQTVDEIAVRLGQMPHDTASARARRVQECHSRIDEYAAWLEMELSNNEASSDVA